MFDFVKSNQLTSAGDDIDITDLPPLDWIWFYYFVTGDELTVEINFNNDTGSNYATRRCPNFSSVWTSHQTSDTHLNGHETTTNTMDVFGYVTMCNIEDQEKIGYHVSVKYDNGTAVTTPHEYPIKWANTTDRINRIDIHNAGTGDFDADSFISVYGS